MAMADDLNLVQQTEINRLSLQLRNAYHSMPINESKAFSTPYGGRMTESIGAWPEFILRGTFCKRSKEGLCSPCFYSRFPSARLDRSEYIGMIKKQISYVTDNFDELIVRCQYGQHLQKDIEISFVLTPTGSFFDNYEFPIDVRLEMEEALVNIAILEKIKMCLHIETHCEDFIEYDMLDIKCKSEIDLLSKLNTKVIFGFESSNNYSRNVLYNKSLSLVDFELAAEKVQNINLHTGAFVFAGLFAYNDLQTYNDVMDSLKYLLSKNIFPVIMFQNVQPYTIADVLLESEEITLIEPITVAWIIVDFISLLKDTPSYWLIADPIGGPPEPEHHIFKNPKITCNACSKSIYTELVNLRVTRNTDAFTSFYETLKQCSCYINYKKSIDLMSIDFESTMCKTDYLIKKCQQNIISYVELKTRRNKMTPLEIAQVKAELLCFGVQMGASAKENGTTYNSYLLDGGFVHAAHFMIGEVVVNTCVIEEFCKHSPYEIVWENDSFVLKKEGKFVCEIEVLPIPDWCMEQIEGRKIGDYLRPHSPDCISCCPKLKCTYIENDEECKFCSLGSYADNNDLDLVLPPEVAAKMIKRALEINPNYEIALSGGTCGSEGKSADYFAQICRMVLSDIKVKPNISVEIAPPDSDIYIEQLYKAGATSLIINIEIANDEKRKLICPGKSEIPKERYMSVLKKAVAVFGRGKVSSVIIAGIQCSEEIIAICEKIISMGVIPTIIPFKPLDSCKMKKHPQSNPEELLYIAKQVDKLLQQANLSVCDHGGCTKCGGCSLESVFQLT